MRKLLFAFLAIISFNNLTGQDTYLDNVLKANRNKLYRNVINNTINKNLSLPLTDSTEEYWQDAFAAMEFLNYKSPWANRKVMATMDSIQNRTVFFQGAMLELLYTIYPSSYIKQVKKLFDETSDPKIFSMCAVYLLKNKDSIDMNDLVDKVNYRYANDQLDPFLSELNYQLIPGEDKKPPQSLNDFLEKKYLPGNTLLISFQREDRNFPGLVLVRDRNGNFIKNEDGSFFAVPQLARSISNLPGYLTNGNTPEGIFRMDGFDHSKSSFIGPTTNIQLTMPFENSASHFFKDLSLGDSAYELNRYKKLLPPNYRNHFPMLQSYHAGKAGRTEIIAHGTTVNPEYYKGLPCYPLTPTQGCLCTKEIWSEETGTLLESDQRRLADAITKAGGPDGYVIVINIDDKKQPVILDDIIPYLKLATQK